MKPFEYVSAQSAASAPDLLGKNGRYLAGGIDLLGEMKEGIADPDRVVNIKSIPGWSRIEVKDGGARLGANVTVAALARDEAVRSAWPALAEAAAEVGSPQIRAVATLGGNLAQHARCWYYRQRDLTCLKRGGASCYGREGQNKYLGIFSGNPCIYPIVSNLAVALAALDARVVVQGGKDGEGERRVTVADLYQKAWDNPLAHNSLAPGELIVAVELAPPAGPSAYLQVSEKGDFDWALVSCAVSGRIEAGKVSAARIVLGSIAPVPFVAEDAAALLQGRTLDQGSVAEAADRALAGATPFAHNGYKISIAKALVRRALLTLAA